MHKNAKRDERCTYTTADGRRCRALRLPAGAGLPGRGSLCLRVRFLLAQLYRKVGRGQEAQEIEADLLKLLAYADPDHPILRQLKWAEAAATTQSHN